jgi:hypothetical protein
MSISDERERQRRRSIRVLASGALATMQFDVRLGHHGDRCGAALLGSALSAIAAAHSARRLAAAQQRTGLTAALEIYGYAVTNLGFEIDRLPPERGQAADAVSSVTARLPMLDWTLGEVSRRTIGRPTIRAIDTYNAAMNRLLLVAPQPILAHMQTINDLVSADTRDERWQQQWSDARAAFTVAARDALQPPPSWWRWLTHAGLRRARTAPP